MKLKMAIFIFVLQLLILCSGITSMGQSYNGILPRRYVTTAGAGLKNGQSWVNAYDKTQLQTAINETGVFEIWVAGGVYTPTLEIGGTGSRYKAFQLKNGVSVYGGFNGTEGSLSSRNISLNQTILSGDLTGNDNYGTTPWTGIDENTFHVFNHPYGFGLNSTAVLDGFTIKGGNADASAPQQYGGGMYNNGNSPTLANIIFEYNSTTGNAGALYNINASNCTITNCSFWYNVSSITSGAVNNNASNPQFNGCLFDSNTTVYGGGAVTNESNSQATFINCRFSGNNATNGTGGAVYNHSSTTRFTNCLFYTNSASVSGGAIFNTQSSVLTVTNSTFTQNSSVSGGALYVDGTSAAIRNSIIWGNTFIPGTNSGRQLAFAAGTCAINYSCYSNSANDISGSPTVSSCITSDPFFVNSISKNFRIYGISPCTDSGNDIYNAETTDIRGTGYGRKLDKTNGSAGTIDMGAYEYLFGSDPACAATVEVANTNDDGTGSLRDALRYTCSTGTITFNSSLNGQTITLTSGDIQVTHGITIDATALSNGITISGNSASRAFYIDAGTGYVTLKKIKVINGATGENGGGLFVNSGKKVTIDGCTFTGCSASQGGAICQASADSVVVQNTTITGCSGNDGGAIRQQNGTLVTTSCLMKSNTVVYQGGAIFQTSGVSTHSSDVIKNNSALWGGAVYLESGTMNMTNDSVSGNTATNTNSIGGAFYHKAGNLNITNSHLVGNSAVSYGGAVYMETSSALATISGGSVIGNFASNGNGGGFYVGNGTLKLKNNTRVKYNEARRVSNNSDGGGIYVSTGTLTLDTVYINNNTAYRNGGGIYIYNSTASMTATRDSIAFNTTTTDAGAGVYVYQGGATFKRTLIHGNYNIHKGAGIMVTGPTNLVSMDSCTISKNATRNASSDVNYGAGIFINSGNLTITNTTFSGNRATNTSNLRTPKGGALYLFQGTLTSTGNTFVSNMVNTTKALGGAIFNDQGTVNNLNCTFTTDSTGRNGGAIYNNAASGTVNNTSCTFTSNYGDNLGGAIYMNAGTLNNTSCTFTTNKCNLSTGAAGAIYLNGGTSTHKSCTFSNNTANASAGLNLRTGYAKIINCLFYGNNAVTHGGAITNELSTATFRIINTTIVMNSAPDNGGGLGIQAGSVVVKNSILWGNTSTSGAQIKSTSGTAIQLHNCDYSNQTNDVVGTVTPTGCINSYPDFVSEASYDYRLGGNSPCADAGIDSVNTESYDIRGSGYARKLNKTTGLTGTIDIGAYEYKNASDPIYGCTNPTIAGAIKNAQFSCGSFDPAAIADSVTPSGEHGTMEYKWQSSTTSATAGFADIAGSTGSSYDPPTLTVSTWYKRFARVNCMSTWNGAGESNVIKITIYPSFVVGSISASQTLCYGSTPAQLTGVAPTGGNPPYSYQWQSSTDNSTFTDVSQATNLNYQPGALSQTKYYRLKQSCAVCGTLITNTVTMTVYDNLVAGSVSASQTLCYNTAPAQLTSVNPTGGTTPYTFQWQSSSDNSSFTDITGATTATYQPGNLTSTTYYRLKQTSSYSCGTVTTSSITITVYDQYVAGSVSAAQTLCYNTTPAQLTSVAPTGGHAPYTYQWQVSSDNSSFSDIGSATGTTYQPGSLSGNKWYRQNQTSSSGCGTLSTTSIKITVYDQFVVGSVGQAQTLCYNNTPALLTNQGPTGGNTPYSYQWQVSSDNSSFSDISGATDQSYQPGSLTTSLWYRQNQTSSSGCGTLSTTSKKITVYDEFVVGSISASQSICYNTTPAQLTGVAPTGGNTPYTYQWQSSADNSSFVDINTATNLNFTPGAMSSTTYYRLKQNSSSSCGSFNTNTVTILVEPTPVSGSLAKTPDLNTICEGPQISATLTAGTGGNGTDVLEYREKTGSSWGSWSAYTSGTNITSMGKTGIEIRTYRDADYCSNGSTITKSWEIIPGTHGGTVSGGQTLCSGANNATLTLSGHTGTILSWQSSTDQSSWIDILNTTSTTYSVTNLSTSTWYRVRVQSGSCPADTSTVAALTVSTYSISGYAKYENNPKTPLDGLKITLKKNGVPLGSPVITGLTGYYSFTGLTNGTYSLDIASAAPGGAWQTWEGVNNTDAAAVLNHINNNPALPIEPPVIRIAASVKLPHPAILTNDYNAIRQAAKYGWGYFDTTKWVFSGATAATGLTNITMNCSDITREIRGLCIGDVNGSYVPKTGNKEASPEVTLVNKGMIPIGDEMLFPLRVEKNMELSAITLYMDYNPGQIEITSVTMPVSNVGEEPDFIAKNGTLMIGWVSSQPVNINENEILLWIHAKQISKVEKTGFSLSSKYVSELAGRNAGIISDALLSITDAGKSNTLPSNDHVTIYPNPASKTMNIGIQMVTEGIVRISVIDMQGKTVLEETPYRNKTGWNSTSHDVSSLPEGVYFVKIVAGDDTFTKKLIIQKN